MTGELKGILSELRRREVQAMSSAADDGYVGISMSPSGVQRFLDAMVPGAPERDDELVPRMLARPQDLTIGDEEWRWYASLLDTEDALVAMGASGGRGPSSHSSAISWTRPSRRSCRRSATSPPTRSSGDCRGRGSPSEQPVLAANNRRSLGSAPFTCVRGAAPPARFPAV